MELKVNNSLIILAECDITDLAVDAIVNAANAQLVLGGGVAGAIRMKGGPAIQAQCHEIAPISVGQAVITTGGKLKAAHVIHAVGPRMGEGDEEEKLNSATVNSLKVADNNNLSTIAFPAISTGIFGFPLDKCAKIMLAATSEYLKGNTCIKEVTFCLFDSKAYDTFTSEMERI